MLTSVFLQRLAIKLQQKEAERYEIEKIENQERRERARLRAMEKAKVNIAKKDIYVVDFIYVVDAIDE